jgi:hypothetical protein
MMKYWTLSKRSYPMLQAFVSNRDDYMKIAEAQRFDQRPFRSMLLRGWINFRPSYGFYLTKEGRQAWHDFHQTDIVRHNPMLPLCAYWREKYDAGGTMSKRKAKVHPISKTA